IVEDLHWADRSTRDLLAYLATYLRSGPVMVVGSFRSDELDRLHPLRRLLSELARNRRVVRLERARFTRAEVTQQVAGLLGADPPTRLVYDIYARSGGNPFFAGELVLAGEGADPRALPPSLREGLLTRMVRLGGRAPPRPRGAPAPGAPQPLRAAVAGLDDQQLLEGLREAVDQQLLQPDGEGYVFRHALLAEAVYGELLAGERVRLHTALAGALEAGLGAGGARGKRGGRAAGGAARGAGRRPGGGRGGGGGAGDPGGAAGLPLGGGRRPAPGPDRPHRGPPPRRAGARLRRGAAAAGTHAGAVGPGRRRRGACRHGPGRAAVALRQGRLRGRQPGRGRGADPPGHRAGRPGEAAAAGGAAARAAGPLPAPAWRPGRAERAPGG